MFNRFSHLLLWSMFALGGLGGCHPSAQVHIGVTPDKAHSLLTTCLEDGTQCLDAFDKAAEIGLKGVAGQALVLHALNVASSEDRAWSRNVKPEIPEVVSLLQAGLALNSTPWLPAGFEECRSWLEGMKTPVPSAIKFDVLGLDAKRPNGLGDQVSFADLPFGVNALSPSLQARMGAAFDAKIVAFRGMTGTVLTAPFVPMSEAIAGIPVPGAPGIEWSILLADAEQALRSDTPVNALPFLKAAFDKLDGSEGKDAKAFIARCSSRLSEFSLTRPEKWTLVADSSKENEDALNQLFAFPRKPSLQTIDDRELRRAFGDGWQYRADLTWALLEQISPLHNAENKATSPLSQGECGRALTYLEKLVAKPVSMDWTLSTPVFLRLARECGEASRVAKLTGTGLAAHTDEFPRDANLAKNVWHFLFSLVSTEKNRRIAIELGSHGFFNKLATSLSQSLPQDRSQRIYPPAFNLIGLIIKKEGGDERKKMMNMLRDIALDRIPPEAPAWWKMAPAVYGGISAYAALSEGMKEGQFELKQFRSQMVYWKDEWFISTQSGADDHLGARIVEFFDAALSIKASEFGSAQGEMLYGEARRSLVKETSKRSQSFERLVASALPRASSEVVGPSSAHPAGEHTSSKYVHRLRPWLAHWIFRTKLPSSLLTEASKTEGAMAELFPTLNELPSPEGELPAMLTGNGPSAQLRRPTTLWDGILTREVARTGFAIPVDKEASLMDKLIHSTISTDDAPATMAAAHESSDFSTQLAFSMASRGQTQDALSKFPQEISLERSHPILVDCNHALDETGHFVLSVKGSFSSIMSHGLSPHASLEWHVVPSREGCKLIRTSDGTVGNFLNQLGLKALLTMVSGDRRETSRALLDLALGLRIVMHNPTLRAAFSRESEVGLLGWVGTLARLQGHLLLGTEIDNAGMTASLWRSTSMADELSSWRHLPKLVPPMVELERIAPLVLSWVDIDDSRSIGTLRAASQAISYRSAVIPTWSADLAVEVLRAALGEPTVASRNIRRIPRSRDTQENLIVSLWKILSDTEEKRWADFEKIRGQLISDEGLGDGLLATIRAYRSAPADAKTLKWLMELATEGRVHPLLALEAANAHALSQLENPKMRAGGLESFQRNVMPKIDHLSFDTAGEAYMKVLPKAVHAGEYQLATRVMRAAREHNRQLEQGDSDFSLQLDVLIQATSLLTGESAEVQKEDLLGRLKPYRQKLAEEWNWLTGPSTREAAQRYLKEFFRE